MRFGTLESRIHRVQQEQSEQGKLASFRIGVVRCGNFSPSDYWPKLAERPDIYLRELVVAAQNERGWEVSDVTLSRTCRAWRRWQTNKYPARTTGVKTPKPSPA